MLERLVLSKGHDLSDLEALDSVGAARDTAAVQEGAALDDDERKASAAAAVTTGALGAATAMARDAAARVHFGAADTASEEEQDCTRAADAAATPDTRAPFDIALARAESRGVNSTSDTNDATPPATPERHVTRAAVAPTTGDGGLSPLDPTPPTAGWSRTDERACEAIERLALAQLHPLYAARYAQHTWDLMRGSASDVRALYDLGYTADMLTTGAGECLLYLPLHFMRILLTL